MRLGKLCCNKFTQLYLWNEPNGCVLFRFDARDQAPGLATPTNPQGQYLGRLIFAYIFTFLFYVH